MKNYSNYSRHKTKCLFLNNNYLLTDSHIAIYTWAYYTDVITFIRFIIAT